MCEIELSHMSKNSENSNLVCKNISESYFTFHPLIRKRHYYKKTVILLERKESPKMSDLVLQQYT